MPYIASMGIYVISKDVMVSLLSDKFPAANDFGSEVIPGATATGGLRVCNSKNSSYPHFNGHIRIQNSNANKVCAV